MSFLHEPPILGCMHGHHHHEAANHDHSDDEVASDSALPELLDLEADVLHSYSTQALVWVRLAAECCGRRRILDLGAGTGAATIPLAQRFSDADVIAVDSSEQMLDRIRTKALDVGLANRVRPIQADLDAVWPAVGPLDLTWASMSLHHLADPDGVLREVLASTVRGGLVAVAEMGDSMRFLPDELGFGPPGFEARVLDAVRAELEASMPALGSDWSARLGAAGFEVVDERVFAIDLGPPHSPQVVRYARLWFDRLSEGLPDGLDADDREALGHLVAGDRLESMWRRGEMRVRGSRIVTLARRV
jgi:SAM-dependent methyltransferase